MSDSIQHYMEIDLALRPGQAQTAAQLARRLGLSERHIKRCIKAMRERFGAPIVARGRLGYVYEHTHFFFPAIGLSERDLFALGLAMRTLERFSGTPLHEQLRSIFDRLAAGLDKHLITVDPIWLSRDVTLSAEPARAIDLAIWETALGCLKRRQVLRFRYAAPGRPPAARSLEIWHCLHWRGEWYLFGKDRAADDFRLFALSRIRAAAATDSTYCIPADFRIADYVDQELGLHTLAGPVYQVAVRFDPSAAAYAGERTWHASQELTSHQDGSLTLRFRTRELPQTASWVLGWGQTATVLEPPELVALVRQHLAGLQHIYGAARSGLPAEGRRKGDRHE